MKNMNRIWKGLMKRQNSITKIGDKIIITMIDINIKK